MSASGCAGLLGLDSGEPLPDDAGSSIADDVARDAGVSSDASRASTPANDADTTSADPRDASTAVDSSTLVCPLGKGNCNGDDKDGCETNLNDPMHCGSCTNQCPPMSACKADACCSNPHAACTADSQCCSGQCDDDKGCH
ncbi:MAG: hypothetical protein ACRELY_12830 [Polyangiaceae bacterium]